MRFSSRKSILALVVAAAVVVPAGLAWACVALVGFKVNGNGVVAPGGTVEVIGTEFARGKPVNIRLDSPTGPVLATHPDPLPNTMASEFRVQVPIPADITPGQHILVATQEHKDMNVGNAAARAAIYVNTSPPVAPTSSDRPTQLAVSSGPGIAGFVLIGLGVAAAGLLLAAGASALASRRGPTPAAETVKTS